jgi:hypothetical protein
MPSGELDCIGPILAWPLISLFKEDFQTYQEPNDTQAILDNAGIPIRNFYFDSTPSNLQRDLGGRRACQILPTRQAMASRTPVDRKNGLRFVNERPLID